MKDLGINRDRAKIWIDDDGFLQSDKPYVLEYMTVTLEEDMKTIMAIDPSGGPYLMVGDNIEGNMIKGFEDTVNKGIKILF